jgi:hypothetical protein
MQVPFFPMILKGLHALTWKFVTEVLVSSLATLLVMAIFSHVTKPASPVARDDGRLTSFEGKPAAAETSETVDDFMQRVALSHVASLKAPASQTASVAASESTAEASTPLPPRPPTALRHDRPSASKVHVAASVPKVLPPVPSPLATIEPPPVVVAASAPVPVKAEPLPPLQYGMRLVSNVGTIISVSQTRVVESVASLGDTLNSLAKKL